MSTLTLVIAPPPREKTPLLVEVPLAPGLDGPFLVSSSKGFIWVADKFPSGVVRAAIRKVPLFFMFREALERVAALSQECGWGNLLPPTSEGAAAAVKHLAEYGFEEIEALVGAEFNVDLFPASVKVTEVPWVPSDWAVVLPQDRAYVGTAFEFGEGRYGLVVHNAARGLGILAPLPPAP